MNVEYLYPVYLEKYGISGGVLAEDVRAALDKNAADVAKNVGDCGKVEEKIQAVLIVSPTYEGVVSDVQAIADIAHEFGIPLIAAAAQLPVVNP